MTPDHGGVYRSIMRATLGWVLALTLLVLCSTASTQAADAPPLAAWGTCAWGSDDCNVCVPDAADAIHRLRDHGDILGFHMNGSPDVDFSHHWQGVQRLMGGGGRYLAVSRSLAGEGTDVSFVIVQMASRNGDGVRYRSNRLNPHWFVQFTAPPAQDRIAVTVPHQAGFTHAGGIQALGNILSVPFERSTKIDPNTFEVIEPGASKVVFYDVSNPLAPAPLEHVVDHTDLADEAG